MFIKDSEYPDLQGACAAQAPPLRLGGVLRSLQREVEVFRVTGDLLLPHDLKKASPFADWLYSVFGVPRFELGTSCSLSKHSNQAELYPEAVLR